jgi:hypothetical protein
MAAGGGARRFDQQSKLLGVSQWGFGGLVGHLSRQYVQLCGRQYGLIKISIPTRDLELDTAAQQADAFHRHRLLEVADQLDSLPDQVGSL